MPVQNMVQNIHGATRMMKAIMTSAVFLMTATMAIHTCGATQIMKTTGITVAQIVASRWFTVLITINTKV